VGLDVGQLPPFAVAGLERGELLVVRMVGHGNAYLWC
jgi:hypothetical protein